MRTPSPPSSLQCLERYLPGATGPLNRASVCMFTNSSDGHFLLDFHPAHGRSVVLGSACSGERGPGAPRPAPPRQLHTATARRP